MSYYKQHIFFCNNRRDNGNKCCADNDASSLRLYMKQQLTELKLTGAGKYRVNLAGCMGRCSEGPVIALYPQGIWYTYSCKADIDDIIQNHLIKGQVVNRLKLPDELVKITD